MAQSDIERHGMQKNQGRDIRHDAARSFLCLEYSEASCVE
jgi:hypothetical protein